MALVETLDIEMTDVRGDRVEAVMPVTPAVLQPFGFVHGGATIALLETVASLGAQQSADLDSERPFGVDVHVRHRKAAKATVTGMLRGVAELDRAEPARTGGIRQFWNVAAYDDEGDVVSEGVVTIRIVPLSRLEEKEHERADARG